MSGKYLHLSENNASKLIYLTLLLLTQSPWNDVLVETMLLMMILVVALATSPVAHSEHVGVFCVAAHFKYCILLFIVVAAWKF